MVDNACAEASQWITFYYACSDVAARGWRQAYRMQKAVQFRNVSTLKQETFNSIDRRIMSSMSRIARVGSRILSAASGRSGSAATGEII